MTLTERTEATEWGKNNREVLYVKCYSQCDIYNLYWCKSNCLRALRWDLAAAPANMYSMPTDLFCF